MECMHGQKISYRSGNGVHSIWSALEVVLGVYIYWRVICQSPLSGILVYTHGIRSAVEEHTPVGEAKEWLWSVHITLQAGVCTLSG